MSSSHATEGARRKIPIYQPRPVRELAAGRLRVTARGVSPSRRARGADPAVLTAGNLSVSLDTYRVTVGDTLIALTTQEFDLLILLLVKKDSMLPYAEISQWL